MVKGVWDGHRHTALFNMGNQQGQLRELCSVLCNNFMVIKEEGEEKG